MGFHAAILVACANDCELRWHLIGKSTMMGSRGNNDFYSHPLRTVKVSQGIVDSTINLTMIAKPLQICRLQRVILELLLTFIN
jgi:hypothetical protein